MMDGPYSEVAQQLSRHGIQLTPQRLAIAKLLFACPQHLSADQVLQGVQSSDASLSKATVYNTLRLFVEKKLLREVIVDPSRVFYDSNMAPHHHLYDTVTGELTDICASSIRVSGLPALPPGVVAEGIDIVVRTRPEGAVSLCYPQV